MAQALRCLNSGVAGSALKVLKGSEGLCFTGMAIHLMYLCLCALAKRLQLQCV